MLDRYLDWLADHAKLVLISSMILVTLLASGLPNLQLSNDFRVYLSKDNPQLQAFEQFEADFGQTNSATLVISRDDGDLFSQQGVSLLSEATDAMWQLPYVIRVDSPANYPYTYAEGDDIYTEPLIGEQKNWSAQELKSLRQRALHEKRLVNRLLTADGKLALVFAQLILPEDEKNPSLVVTTALENLSQKLAEKYPEFRIEYGGSTTFNTTLSRAVARDLETLLPISYLVIFAGLWWLLRRMAGTLMVFSLVTLSLLATFGSFGWVAPVLTPIAGFAPSILLSIMVADAVHLLTTFYQQLEQGDNKEQAMRFSLKLNLMPVFLTSITTIIGFLTLNFSSSPPYQSLGNMVAVGVTLALLFSVYTLPAMMLLIAEGSATKQRRQIDFSGFARWVIARSKKLLVGVALLALLLGSFLPANRLSDNWAHYFSDEFAIVRLVNRIDGYLSGTNGLEYALRPAQGLSITDPKYLGDLDSLQRWFETQPKVMTTHSLADIFKDLNQTFHGDDAAYYRVPESAELAAQFLLLYELSLPQGQGLDNIIPMARDRSRLSVSVTNAGSDELLALDRKAQIFMQQNLAYLEPSEATGLGMVFAHIAERNIEGLLKGTALALLLISLLLILLLRSLKMGLISLIPNLVPALMAYGLWGLIFGYVDISLSIVACATLGIVVDDTIHFLHKYQHARAQGLSPEQAVENSFKRVGVPLLTTSAVLSAGFLILALSPMNTSATIGLLMAITLMFALVVDFLMLPGLLLLLHKDKEKT